MIEHLACSNFLTVHFLSSKIDSSSMLSLQRKDIFEGVCCGSNRADSFQMPPSRSRCLVLNVQCSSMLY